jgi:catechol 2,3-dioxygenase-like lactoylglutathione lyase family enzyme
MKFRISSNIAIRTSRYDQAVDFYASLLDLSDRSQSPGLADFEAGPLNLFVIEDEEVSGPVMELFVDDLEQAKVELMARGCEVIRWRGKGQDCYVRDPFGVMFNVWET